MSIEYVDVSNLVECNGCHGTGDGGDGAQVWACGYCGGTGLTTIQMNIWIAKWKEDPSYIPSELSEQHHMETLRLAEGK